MSFITQGRENNCGAFCFCYLKWLLEGRSPASPPPVEEAQKLVDRVYRYIQFRESRPSQIPNRDLPADYCAPAKMLSLLLPSHPNTVFHIVPGSPIWDIFQVMRSPWAPEEYYIDLLAERGRVNHNEDLPVPLAGKFSIAVFAASIDGTPIGLHYILVQKTGTGLFRYNPWDGVAASCNGYEDFDFTDHHQTVHLSFAHTGLLVK